MAPRAPHPPAGRGPPRRIGRRPLSRRRPRRPPPPAGAGARPRMSRRCHLPPGRAAVSASSHGATKHRPSGLPLPRLQWRRGASFARCIERLGPSPRPSCECRPRRRCEKACGGKPSGAVSPTPRAKSRALLAGPRPRAVRAFRRLASAVPRHDAPVTQEGSPAILAGLTPARNAGARKTCASGPILPSMVTNGGLTSPLASRARDGPAVSQRAGLEGSFTGSRSASSG